MTYHCGITSPGKRWQPSYLAFFTVRLDRTSEKNSVRNTPAQVGGWSKWLNTIGLSSSNRCNSLIHQTLPAGITEKKDPGALSIKKLIDTPVPAGDTVRNSGGVVYVGEFKATLQSHSRWEACSSGSSAGRVALGSWQTVLRQALGRRHWEDWAGIALSGGRKHVVETGMEKGGCLQLGSVSFLPLRSFFRLTWGSYLRLFPTPFMIRRKRCGNISEK